MAAMGVTPMPRPTGPDDEGVPPADIYRVAVDEYRFQAQYNWSRTQYLLALNVAVMAAASAVASANDRARGAGLIFAFGIVASALAGLVVRQQHDYYRAARKHMVRVEQELGIPDNLKLDTTSTLGGRKRLLSVNQVVFILLGALALADAIGVGLMLAR